MQELLEQLLRENNLRVNELDFKKALKTAAVAGVIGTTALGLGYKKGLANKEIGKPIVTTKVEQPVKKFVVDINKIIKIESGGDLTAENKKSGARGLCQIIEPTWGECTRLMGKDWSWADAFDGEKNRAVGNFYMNIRIPQMLKYYKIPDTIKIRLACYDWGIGNVKRAYDKYNAGFLEFAPQETKDYVKKYIGL